MPITIPIEDPQLAFSAGVAVSLLQLAGLLNQATSDDERSSVVAVAVQTTTRQLLDQIGVVLSARGIDPARFEAGIEHTADGAPQILLTELEQPSSIILPPNGIAAPSDAMTLAVGRGRPQ